MYKIMESRILDIHNQYYKYESERSSRSVGDVLNDIVKECDSNGSKVYEYVLNHIETEYYPGISKSSLAVLETGRGNSFDQSILLSRLLTLCGVKNTIGVGEIGWEKSPGLYVPFISQFPFKNVYVLQIMLRELGLLSRGEESNNIYHAWVMAEIGNKRVRMDPSWKYRYKGKEVLETSILDSVPFDENGFLSKSHDLSVADYYERQVMNYLRIREKEKNSIQGSSIKDVQWMTPFVKFYVDKDGMNFPTTNFDEHEDGVQYFENIEDIPMKYKHQMEIQIIDNSNSSRNVVLTYRFEVSKHCLDRISIHWLPSSHQNSNQVSPSIMINDEIVQQSPSYSVERGKLLHVNFISSPGSAVGESTNMEETTNVLNKVISGQLIVLFLECDQHSEIWLERQTKKVISLTLDYLRIKKSSLLAPETEETQSIKNKILVNTVHLGGIFYGLRHYQESVRIDNIVHALPFRKLVGFGVVSGSPVESSLENPNRMKLPFPVLCSHYKVDVCTTRNHIHIHRIVEPKQWERMAFAIERIQGWVLSNLENMVWEDLFGMSGISTVRSLQLSGGGEVSGVRTVRMNADDYEAKLKELELPKCMVNRFQKLFDVPPEEKEFIEVITPSRIVSHKSWKGLGWFERIGKNKLNFFVDQEDRLKDEYHLNGSETTGPPTDPPSTIDSGTQDRTPGTEVVAGDPVNISNGNVTIDECDISIPIIYSTNNSRGGSVGGDQKNFLSFRRHYDSQSDLDFGMGKGWSFSFMEFIQIEDENSREFVHYKSNGQRIRMKLQEDNVTLSYENRSDEDGHRKKYLKGEKRNYVIYVHDLKNGETKTFRKIGYTKFYLSEIRDRNGSRVRLYHKKSEKNIIVSVVWNHITLNFGYTDYTDSVKHITRITDNQNQIVWNYQYKKTENDQVLLTSVHCESKTTATTSSKIEKRLYIYHQSSHSCPSLSGILKGVIKPSKIATFYEYYPNRRCFRVTKNVFSTTRSRFHSHRLYYEFLNKRTIFVDEKYHRFVYQYDDVGNLLKLTYPDNLTELYTWKGTLCTSHVNQMGFCEFYKYDDRGNVIEYVDFEKNVRSYEYDEHYQCVKEIDGNKNMIKYEYLPNGRCSGKSVFSSSSSSSSVWVETMKYSPSGLMETKTFVDMRDESSRVSYSYSYNNNNGLLTAESRKTENDSVPGVILRRTEYDFLGNPTLTHSLGSGVKRVSYGLYGLGKDHHPLITRMNYGNNTKIENFEYDPRGYLVGKKVCCVLGNEPERVVRRYVYDDDGNVIKEIFPDGGMKQYKYEEFGKISVEEDLNRALTFLDYDCNGNVEVKRAKNNNDQKFYLYSACGKLVKIQKNNGSVVIIFRNPRK